MVSTLKGSSLYLRLPLTLEMLCVGHMNFSLPKKASISFKTKKIMKDTFFKFLAKIFRSGLFVKNPFTAN